MNSPLLQPVLRPLLQPVLGPLQQSPVGANSSFDPLTLYAGGGPGIWVEQVDAATRFQDTAGTIPATTAGQPVGLIKDKSGRGNDLRQTTDPARPVYAVSPASGAFDGIDDGLTTAGFSAGTMTNNMDCLIGIKRNNGNRTVIVDGKAPGIFAVVESANTAAANLGTGTPTYFVDGVAVPGGTGTSRDQLNTAIPSSAWHILEVRNLDLSTWTSFGVGFYSSFALTGNLSGIILCEAQTEAKRAQIRTYLGNQVGLTL